MKIEDSGSLARTSAIQPKPPKAPTKKEIEDQAIDAASVSALADKVLTSNESRIAELQRMHEAGSYAVPAAGIAKSILDEHVEK